MSEEPQGVGTSYHIGVTSKTSIKRKKRKRWLTANTIGPFTAPCVL